MKPQRIFSITSTFVVTVPSWEVLAVDEDQAVNKLEDEIEAYIQEAIQGAQVDITDYIVEGSREDDYDEL